MHDIDRVQLERSLDTEAYEGETAFEGEWAGESGRVFDEAQEMELASDLLEIQSEEELDHFIGGLVGLLPGIIQGIGGLFGGRRRRGAGADG